MTSSLQPDDIGLADNKHRTDIGSLIEMMLGNKEQNLWIYRGH
jgi:hypothetical protein